MAEDQPKEKKLNQLLTSRIADIYVGPDNTHWPLHEKLLCYHSPFLASKFYSKDAQDRPGQNKSFGLPDEDEFTFELMVGWLYSQTLKTPSDEKEIGPLLDLYLLSDKLEMDKLSNEIVDTVRQFYHDQNAYPGLRRVQYVYANTDDDNAMREMMVSSIARYLALGDTIPSHWNKALRKNGELAVDIIRAIQEWHLESRTIPDARDTSSERGKGGAFSKVEPEQGDESFATQNAEDADDTEVPEDVSTPTGEKEANRANE